jgi:F-type H+-transporting ATPase subunit a
MGCTKRFILIFVLVLCGITSVFASEEVLPDSTKKAETGSEKFEPGSFIFEHIGDAYSWHIFTYHHKHYSIPLPVIVYSKQTGWHLFSSSNLNHSEEGYNNFKICEEGSNKGKIVEMVNGVEVRPIDISITKNVCSLLISVLLILSIFLSIAKRYNKNPNKAPKGVQSLLEPIILFVRDDVVRPSLGHKADKYMPYLLTLFFFIWLNNMMGLIPIFPGGANLTGNIAVTLTLAVLTFVITTFSGNKSYWLHIFNPPGVPWWLKLPIPLIPFIEFISIFIKPFVLMVRLFANITAGHVIALGFYSLIFIFGAIKPGMGFGVSPVSILFTFFMALLELLVAFIQAYVFTLLSALYFAMATEEHH